MESRSARQFALSSAAAAVILLILGRFELSRLGFSPEYDAVDLRLVGMAVASMLLVPWWMSFRPPGYLVEYALLLITGLSAFALYMVLSSAWLEYAGTDVSTMRDLGYLIVILVLFLLPFTVEPAYTARLVIAAFATISLLYTIGGLALGPSSDRISFLGGGPNVYGRVIGLGVIATLSLVGTRSLPTWSLLAVPFQLAAVVLSGSRGAMVATLIGLVIATIPRWRRLLRARSVVVLTLAAALLWHEFGSRVTEMFHLRVVELTVEQNYLAGRDQLMPVAVGLFRGAPVTGGGLGSFGAVLGNPEEYAHNIVLQVLAEGGLLGFALLVLSLAHPFVSMCRCALRSPTALTLLAMSAMVLVAALFSGTYYDFRLMWAFTFAGGMLARSLRYESRPAANRPARTPARSQGSRAHGQGIPG